ncbi:fimbrial protein, partial [Klebsiella michiganensis]
MKIISFRKRCLLGCSGILLATALPGQATSLD